MEEVSIPKLKEAIALVWDYISETSKWKAKLVVKHVWKGNVKSFANKTLNFFYRKFCFSHILDLVKTVWALRILSQGVTRNFVIKEFETGEPGTCESLTFLRSVQRDILSINWYINQNF